MKTINIKRIDSWPCKAMYKMQKEMRLVDIVFICQDFKKVGAHRKVLEKCNIMNRLLEMFSDQNEKKCCQNEDILYVSLPDYSSKAIQGLIDIYYLGKFNCFF